MTRRVVVVDDGFGDAEVERAAVAGTNVAIEYRPCHDVGDLADVAAGAQAVIVRFQRLSPEVLAGLDTVQVIGRYGVGVDNIDLAAASRRGIAVINVPDYCVEEVAQHAVALTLAAWRRIPTASALAARGNWNDWAQCRPIRPLSECTLGLVGLGRIGRELVRQFAPMFRRIVAHDPYGSEAPAGVDLLPLADLLATSDIVSLHCPLTAETEGLMNAVRLAQMKPDSLLVNVSRGALVDTADLTAALAAGRPSRAALDVLPTEPPVDSDWLLSHPNVLVTPHMAWYSTTAERRLRELLARRCADYLLGNPVPTVVNASELAAAR